MCDVSKACDEILLFRGLGEGHNAWCDDETQQQQQQQVVEAI
jgi:hypothetical protein